MVFTVRAIIEVLGKPESHIAEVMNKVIEKLKSEEGITLVKHEVTKPEVVKQKSFSVFAEVEVKIVSFTRLLNFCYDYLPTSVEVLDTEKVVLPVREFVNGLNDSLTRLHQYNLMVNNLLAKQEEKKK